MASLKQLKERLQKAAVVVEKAREALNKAQEEYDLLFKQASEGARSRRNTKQPIENKAATPLGLEDHIYVFLKEQPNGAHYNTVAEKLNAKPATIRAMLYSLKQKGKVERVSRGTWKAIVIQGG